MDFVRVEKQVKSLHRSFKLGQVSESVFRSRLFDMMLQDKAGTWWMVSYKTGQWHRYDGQRWLPDLHPLRKTQLFKRNAWWLICISTLLLLPSFGVSIIGVVSSIGMISNQEWGRKGNVFYSLLLEGSGLITVIGVLISLTGNYVYDSDSFLYWAIAIAGLLGFSSGALFTPRLIALGTTSWDEKARLQRPFEIWHIALPLLLTILGTVPALGLLLKKKWGRISSVYAIYFLMGTLALATIVAVSNMRSRYYSSYSNGFVSHTNDWGIAIALIEMVIMVIWCIVAIVYLMQHQNEEWLNN